MLRDRRQEMMWLIWARSQMKSVTLLVTEMLPTRTFSATQATSQFDHNEQVQLCEWVEPWRENVREQLSSSPLALALKSLRKLK